MKKLLILAAALTVAATAAFAESGSSCGGKKDGACKTGTEKTEEVKK